MSEKNWLEREIEIKNQILNKPNKYDREKVNRDKIGHDLTKIGFYRKQHINGSSLGAFSYEQYIFEMNEYNTIIICAVGSEAIHVGAKNLDDNQCYHLFTYKSQAVYRWAKELDESFEEFKNILKLTFFKYLENLKNQKELLKYYEIYDLNYNFEKQNFDVSFNVFCN